MLHVSVDKSAGDTPTVYLTIEDVQGTYTLPYLQSDRDLNVRFHFADSEVAGAHVVLRLHDKVVGEKDASPPEFRVDFPGLSCGEYAMEVTGVDKEGRSVCQASYGRIGIGVVMAALGDSITEGYYGRGFWKDDLRLRADQFPADAVSRDGRNFPQFAPTTHEHLPSVNCFESWMTQLNDRMSQAWDVPVFIANEGWGGITSEGYLRLMRNDAGWQKRMRALRPQLWMIHLGVNDERAKAPPETFAATMEGIVALLIEAHGAQPDHILLAKPCYDYFEGAPEILAAYCKEIDGLVARRGLRSGADFFAGYAADQKRWYGEDPVHPNVEGMQRMAQLWHEAIVRAFPKGVRVETRLP
jgi:lysophospholipase L1-like esterase